MDEKPTVPIDIARLALKQLAYSKVPPTPDNFRKVYDDISGVKSRNDEFTALAKAVDGILKDAGKTRPRYLNLSKAFRIAMDDQDFKEAELILRQLLPDTTSDGVTISWGNVLRDLVKHLDVDNKHPAISKKTDSLEQVLMESDADPETMLRKVHELTSSWHGNGNYETAANNNHARQLNGRSTTHVTEVPENDPDLSDQELSADKMTYLWRDLLIEALELGLVSQFSALPEIERKTRVLLDQAKQANTANEVVKLGLAFKTYWKKLEQNASIQTKFQEALVKLFRLLVENMGELANGDQWLYGQIQMVREVVANPLSLETLRDAENKLEDLLLRQSILKRSLLDAKLALKQMAVTCIDMLATIAENSGEHQEKIAQYQKWISETEDILELNAILENLRHDMHHMQSDALRTFEELKQSHEKVIAADLLIDKLSLELDQASELASRDFLTGILNRRGADDALEREFARAERTQRPVCVALLDLDHFKNINDTYGHDAGDEAIVHLVDVARSALRPADLLSRYGG
ncbi:MAG: GGDEF domain-containing protein, partial [Nitrosomonadales bacterium]|nr:GGDEF domain-containing protein [Nitrosomonadales bacterium]